MDITGKTYGHWVVIKFTSRDDGGNALWLCKCECGTKRLVRYTRLVMGKSKSCGCRGLTKGQAGVRQLLLSYKKSAKTNGRKFELTVDEFEALTKSNCFYCGSCPSRVKRSKRVNKTVEQHGSYIYNGIDRIDNSKGYVSGNCVTCCIICNRAKNTMPQEEFLAWIGRIADHANKSLYGIGVKAESSVRCS